MNIKPFCFKHNDLSVDDMERVVTMILETLENDFSCGDLIVSNIPDTLTRGFIDGYGLVDTVPGSEFDFFGFDGKQFLCIRKPELYHPGSLIIESPTIEIITRHILEGSE